eukprot:TRINITY_DN356_c0_g1_i5.p1 TRINITY_DN356_c0_g1~~TRINITY_DN356_c0_g1_i5.p1  ORF type:complete len:329 (+),score=64.05 TRINITY_DN356_c0_g1_i5:236-1222(+)
MSAFWRELLANPEFPLGVRHFETPVLGDLYSGCGFYVRPVYEEILSTLIRYFNVSGGLKHYAITGTPGIGKSYFAAYLLAAVVRQFTSRPEAGTVLVHDHAPPLVYVDDEGIARRLLWDGRVARVDDEHIECLSPNAFIIFDGTCDAHGKLVNVTTGKHVLWISSPRHSATSLTNPFQKFVNKECDILCVPVLDEVEVFEAEAAWRGIETQSEAEKEQRRRIVRERFQQCGGVARVLFGNPMSDKGNIAFKMFQAAVRNGKENDVRCALDAVSSADIDLYFEVRRRLVHCVPGLEGTNPFALVNMEFASVRLLSLSPVFLLHTVLLPL